MKQAVPIIAVTLIVLIIAVAGRPNFFEIAGEF